ncbi:Lsr2 dimerization domain-containing protein [Nocardia sp. NPDC055002]
MPTARPVASTRSTSAPGDFHGTSEADETVTFGIDGVTYEIGLSDTNATKLRDTFDQ